MRPIALARTGLAAAVTFSALAACCSTAEAAGYIQIVPVGVTSYVYGVDLSQLPGAPAPDITNRAYNGISTAGGPPRSVTVTSGYSVPELLEDLDPGISFTFAEVLGPDGRSVLLTNPQATSVTGTYPDGPPVVWQDSTGVHFLVPSLPGGGAYAGQSFSGQADTITINLHSGSLLNVGISSSTQKVALDKPVKFRSTVTGASPGTSLNYRWSFGDGNGGSQAAVTHHYIVAGTYDVYLRVSSDDDSLGFSSVIAIEVGKAPKGPNRQGGGTSKKKKAATSGAGSKGSGGKKSTAKKVKSTTTKAASKPTGAKPSTPTTSTTTTTTTKPAAKPSPPRDTAVRRALRPAGALLSGVAISATPKPPERSSPTAPARPGVPDPARTGHLSATHHGPGEGFWIALGILATLIGGALLEWSGPPRTPPIVRARAPRFD